MGTIEAKYEILKSLRGQLISSEFDFWRHHALFTWQWWMLVVLAILSWAIWWKTVDKSRLNEIVLFGAIILIITIVLDGLGTELMIWNYPIQVTPTYGRFLPVDFAALPITYMWGYQYFRSWRSFFVAVLIMAVMFAFLLEPVMAWIGVYDPMNWRHIYSLPVYVLLPMSGRWLTQRVNMVSSSAR